MCKLLGRGRLRFWRYFCFQSFFAVFYKRRKIWEKDKLNELGSQCYHTSEVKTEKGAKEQKAGQRRMRKGKLYRGYQTKQQKEAGM